VEDERGHEELAAAGTEGNEMLRKPSHCCWQHVPVPQLGHTCHRVGLRGCDVAGVTWGITPRWPVALLRPAAMASGGAGARGSWLSVAWIMSY
jgi:hypothetical protein